LVSVKPYGLLQGVRPGKLVDQLLDYGFSPEEIIHRLELERKVRRDRAELLVRTTVRQRELLVDVRGRRDLVSLYVGVPFCPTRCAYCSFPSHSLSQYREREREEYFQGLMQELNFLRERAESLSLSFCTVYIGGGTPTTLSDSQLSILMTFVDSLPWWEGRREVTFEGGRPDTMTAQKLQSLPRDVRLSINPQSMHDKTLRAIGREHTVQEVREGFALARSLGFSNVNADLIIGLPEEGVSEVEESVRDVLLLRPDSVTVHMFAPKRASKFAQGTGWQPMDESQAHLASSVVARDLSAAGMQPYYLYRQRGILAGLENMGWAHEGKECLYNVLIIGESQIIVGAGAGASSKFVLPNTEWDHQVNPKDPKVYLKRMEDTLKTKEDLLDKWRKRL
jgi:oxygen-independent coproporphyrinogen-3 oxidase